MLLMNFDLFNMISYFKEGLKSKLGFLFSRLLGKNNTLKLSFSLSSVQPFQIIGNLHEKNILQALSSGQNPF